jgi:hypothetical protein
MKKPRSISVMPGPNGAANEVPSPLFENPVQQGWAAAITID